MMALNSVSVTTKGSHHLSSSVSVAVGAARVVQYPGPQVFFLVQNNQKIMTTQLNESSLWLSLFYGRGDEDAAQHWFLCYTIWNAQRTTDMARLVEFQTTLRGRRARKELLVR